MRSALPLLAGLVGAARAQGPPLPPTLRPVPTPRFEVSAGAITALAAQDFHGVVVGLARRTGTTGQGRLALAAAGGAFDGQAGVRVEATAQFLLGALSGGAGAAYLGAHGRRGRGVLLALLGLESGAGRRRGWYVEIGLGGGIRAAVGARWRS